MARLDVTEVPAAWYRIGDGFLGLSSADAGFSDRFADIYRECSVSGPPEGGPVVECRIRHDKPTGRIRVEFTDPEPLDQAAFSRSLLADFGVTEFDGALPGAVALSLAGRNGVVELSGASLVADAGGPWQSLTAALALHRVMRLQRNVLFFHAASVAVRGRGLLLIGDKGAGKTTLALSLADRGHALLGDETAALRSDTLELVPLRRRLSIRPGPQSPGVARRLDAEEYEQVVLPDGTPRTRVHPGVLFQGSGAAPARVRTVVFLGKQSAKLRHRHFTPGRADLARLQPYESAVCGSAPGAVAVRLLRLLGEARCYDVEPGGVVETARVLENIMEDE